MRKGKLPYEAAKKREPVPLRGKGGDLLKKESGEERFRE
jgi:hypothetical protein